MDRMTLRPEAVPSSSPGADDHDQQFSHDAFAVIRTTKPQYGGGVQLFGSELRHNTAVAIQICRATSDRHLSNNWIHGEETIVEVVMSEAQWAHFVSNHGNHTGTPCTLNYAPKPGTKAEAMPYIDMENFVKTFSREIEQKTKKYMEGIEGLIKGLEDLAGHAGSVSKRDLKELVFNLKNQTRNLPSNMRFIQDQLHEAVEKTVSDGKIEIEAMVGNMAMHLGMEQLRQMAPRLEAPEPLDSIQLAEQQAVKQLEATHEPDSGDVHLVVDVPANPASDGPGTTEAQ